jgi:hypothetical protein
MCRRQMDVKYNIGAESHPVCMGEGMGKGDEG